MFDYVDGGADEELSLAGNVEAFRRWRFMPRALTDASAADTTGQVLGRPVPLPLVLAPAGFTRLAHPGGEIAAARSAARHGLPYTLSTMANTSIPDLAAAVRGDLWFQLYILADGGMTVPPELTVRTIASIGSHPGYWLRMLRSPAIRSANLSVRESLTIPGTARYFRRDITWDDIAALRQRWTGKLVIKGPLGAADARRAGEAGADGVQLSNHGGRQLDRAAAPIDLLPAVRDAVGQDLAVLVDSGVRHGADIATAVALGADAAAVGRAYLYGLMAAGEPGVDKALDLLAEQFRRTLQLLGVTSVAELRKHGPELLSRG